MLIIWSFIWETSVNFVLHKRRIQPFITCEMAVGFIEAVCQRRGGMFTEFPLSCQKPEIDNNLKESKLLIAYIYNSSNVIVYNMRAKYRV